MSEQPMALRLADEMEHYFNDRGPDAETVADELRRLVAENEALRADAERYRWLKDHCALGIKQNGAGWSLNTRQCVAPDSMHDIDAAIDAARSKT